MTYHWLSSVFGQLEQPCLRTSWLCWSWLLSAATSFHSSWRLVEHQTQPFDLVVLGYTCIIAVFHMIERLVITEISGFSLAK